MKTSKSRALAAVLTLALLATGGCGSSSGDATNTATAGSASNATALSFVGTWVWKTPPNQYSSTGSTTTLEITDNSGTDLLTFSWVIFGRGVRG